MLAAARRVAACSAAAALLLTGCDGATTFTLAAEHDGVNVEKYQLLVDGTMEQELAGPMKELRFTTRIPATCARYTVTAVNAAGSASAEVVVCREFGSGRAVIQPQGGAAPPARDP